MHVSEVESGSWGGLPFSAQKPPLVAISDASGKLRIAGGFSANTSVRNSKVKLQAPIPLFRGGV